jgi:hypothetical protein
MARRVRGYVTQSKTNTSLGASAPGRVTSSERKALATMGRKGGQKAAQRWKTEPDGEYAQAQKETLSLANKRRAAGGRSNSYKIASFFDDSFAQTGEYPTVVEAAKEFSVSKRTVQRALSKAGIELPTGRRKG